ncbi:MAG TPA: GyrI-like domain-containing protein [Candidatus Acidoferrum sp.]|jgi:AraC family transcriptional regulator
MTQSGAGQSSVVKLDPPSFVTGKAMVIAGLKERFTSETMDNIAQLWQRFVPHIGHIPGQVGRVGYGVFANMTANPFGFDYMAGVEVSSTSGLPAGFSHVNVPEQRYVVFAHHGPVSNIRATIDAVHKWLPTSGLSAAQPGHDLPVMLERYGEGFDPQTGGGDIEIWTPITA